MGWILVNIVLPAFSPVFLISVFFLVRRFLPPKNQALVRFIAPIKDGQLCWAGLACCAAALYEMHEARYSGVGLSDVYDGTAQFFFSATGVLNAMIATTGSVFPVDLPRPSTERRLPFYIVLLSSWVFAILSGAAFVLVHFRLEDILKGHTS